MTPLSPLPRPTQTQEETRSPISSLTFSSLKVRSQKIQGLKKILPAIACLLTLVVVLWPQINAFLGLNHKSFLNETMPEKNAATKPVLKGTDVRNQPYIIRAQMGYQISEQEIFLENPVLELRLNSGGKVILSADKGTLLGHNKNVHLNGSVTLQHSDGYNLQTLTALIDCNNSSASGDDPVDGTGPTGTIQSRGFRLEDYGDKVVFLGQPELLLSTEK
jgi:lipopolysaccharide export system protein LptC